MRAVKRVRAVTRVRMSRVSTRTGREGFREGIRLEDAA